jgi:hypothetical protein
VEKTEVRDRKWEGKVSEKEAKRQRGKETEEERQRKGNRQEKKGLVGITGRHRGER